MSIDTIVEQESPEYDGEVIKPELEPNADPDIPSDAEMLTNTIYTSATLSLTALAASMFLYGMYVIDEPKVWLASVVPSLLALFCYSRTKRNGPV